MGAHIPPLHKASEAWRLRLARLGRVERLGRLVRLRLGCLERGYQAKLLSRKLRELWHQTQAHIPPLHKASEARRLRLARLGRLGRLGRLARLRLGCLERG